MEDPLLLIVASCSIFLCFINPLFADSIPETCEISSSSAISDKIPRVFAFTTGATPAFIISASCYGNYTNSFEESSSSNNIYLWFS